MKKKKQRRGSGERENNIITNKNIIYVDNSCGGGYFHEVNIARGIVVLCVLLGHAFPDAQTGMSDKTAIWIHSVVYSFHMGCFFLLAGFSSGRKLCNVKADIKTEIIKKIKRLMVPYFFYSVITLMLKQVFSTFANNQFKVSEIWKIFLGKNPNGGIWFLWTLFIISVLFLLINQVCRKSILFLGISVIFMIAIPILPSTFMDSVLSYSVYYALGIMLQQNYEKISLLFHGVVGASIAVSCAVVFILLTFVTKIPYFITCLLGTMLVLILSYQITERQVKNQTKNSILYMIFNELGNYSYDIYLISYFVQVPIRVVFYRMFSLPYWAVVLIMFVMGAVIPYLLSKHIIRKIPIANMFMLGNWNRV